MLKKSQYQIELLLVLSVLFAIVWTYLTRSMYNYNLGFGTVGGLNIFPLVNWTIGLAASYLIFSYILDKLNIKSLPKRFVSFTLLSFLAVIIAETVGYYVLGIHNTGTSAYAGLPICNCLHAPAWMQFGYFALGPLYWLTYTVLKDSVPMLGGKQKA